MKQKVILLLGLGIVLVASRLLPHPANVSPLTAVALLGGAVFSSSLLWTLFLFSILVLTDFVLGFHSTIFFVYSAFALQTLIGQRWIKLDHFSTLFSGSLLGTGLFFIISNFGVWMTQELYTKDSAGLLQCYIMALPFLKFSLLGDLFWITTLYFILRALKQDSFFTKVKVSK